MFMGSWICHEHCLCACLHSTVSGKLSSSPVHIALLASVLLHHIWAYFRACVVPYPQLGTEIAFCVNAFPKRFQIVIARLYMDRPLWRGERDKEECIKVCYIQKVSDSLSKDF